MKNKKNKKLEKQIAVAALEECINWAPSIANSKNMTQQQLIDFMAETLTNKVIEAIKIAYKDKI